MLFKFLKKKSHPLNNDQTHDQTHDQTQDIDIFVFPSSPYEDL